MKRRVRVTPAQVRAAQAMVKRYTETGRPIPAAVQRIADAAKPRQTLDESLAALEATDPKVRAAAQAYDDMIWRVTHPDDVANPFRDDAATLSPTSPAPVRSPQSSPASDGPGETVPGAGEHDGHPGAPSPASGGPSSGGAA